jgi:hypothetical protein
MDLRFRGIISQKCAVGLYYDHGDFFKDRHDADLPGHLEIIEFGCKILVAVGWNFDVYI